MSERAQPTAFWNNFIRAVEAEPQEAVSLTGASAIPHSVAGVGLDRSRHRLIVISHEEGALEAAFVQADLQSAFKSIRVIVVRPSSNIDTIKQDRRAGLCSFSFSQFAQREIELILQQGAEVEAIKDIFRRHNLFQYFFPAPDHLALGLIESRRVSFLPQLIDQLVRTPDLGHPFGPNELMTVQYSFTEMVKELQNLGLVKERESGLEITDEGLKARALVSETAREALLNKILNQLSANLYLKSLLHPELKMPR
ncbi:MAG TPA: hypothetical protein VKB86_14520 [Pyrinomonadaceae bacterium]|nr:hypothetical protein [Pyrinomonadaceae bacterium]